MTDKKLLEYAAKAAGINGEYHDLGIYQFGTWGEKSYWNPIADDCDAFRLAVKLRFAVEQMRVTGGYACVCTNTDTEEDVRELHYGDAFSATRRAIVRAAAEIGKEMP